MRLDKFLVECGIGSRTEVKAMLKKKEFRVNGQIETSPKLQIDEHKAKVEYRGQDIQYEKLVYYMMNKPSGVLSATEDAHQKTVLDLLDDNARLKKIFPVGRLDKDTRGLLLLTNDGDLAHRLLSPKKHVDKLYEAKITGVMTEEDIAYFAKGIALKDFTCQPAHLEIIEQDKTNKTSLVHITISEGKFHQVKRMVQACGKQVTDLKRLKMGTLELDITLSEGSWRRLTSEELQDLTSTE